MMNLDELAGPTADDLWSDQSHTESASEGGADQI
jgi:hypothetical protein